MNKVKNNLVNYLLPAGLEKIDQVREGFMINQVLSAALELGLFDWLDEHGSSDREEIVSAIKMNGMFSRSFLQTLIDAGFLVSQAGKYSNTGIATQFLVQRSPFYQGDLFKSTSAPNSKWTNLIETLTKEVPVDNFYAGPDQTFINAIGQRSLRGEIQEVTKAISAWAGFSKARSLLDLGGGHGLYAIALCQANPQLKGTIFDKPDVIEFAGKNITGYMLDDRIAVQGGDLFVDEIGSGYDIVIISHLLYKFRKDLPLIFDKAYACLNPGGLLVTNHWFCSSECLPVSRGVIELGKSLQSFGHPLCHLDDFQTLFQQKGFSVINAVDIPSVYDTSKLHLAVKKVNFEEELSACSKCCSCK